MSENPPAEPTTVQLTRMEGVLNLVAFQVTDLVKRVDRHELEIGQLKMSTQQLASNAEANIQTVEATAKALREAKESEEAAARRAWSPVTKLFALGAFLLAMVNLYQALIH